mmetsp:Transcript_55456/g.98783  ORF Transcript_55456/g.98783 Transcript_55456/m.98783 type:complete len:318 (-) Transcript_55456:142-1095(-)
MGGCGLGLEYGLVDGGELGLALPPQIRIQGTILVHNADGVGGPREGQPQDCVIAVHGEEDPCPQGEVQAEVGEGDLLVEGEVEAQQHRIGTGEGPSREPTIVDGDGDVCEQPGGPPVARVPQILSGEHEERPPQRDRGDEQEYRRDPEHPLGIRAEDEEEAGLPQHGRHPVGGHHGQEGIVPLAGHGLPNDEDGVSNADDRPNVEPKVGRGEEGKLGCVLPVPDVGPEVDRHAAALDDHGGHVQHLPAAEGLQDVGPQVVPDEGRLLVQEAVEGQHYARHEAHDAQDCGVQLLLACHVGPQAGAWWEDKILDHPMTG